MFSTKNFVIEINDVPSYWVFQYYLDLPEKLTGQDVKIKSIFNPSERTPSFVIYVDTKSNQYKFKDFSTGVAGSKSDLVQKIFNLNFTQAVNNPATRQANFVKTAPTNVTVSSSDTPIYFDRLGRAHLSSGVIADSAISVNSKTITIIGETGFVYEQ